MFLGPYTDKRSANFSYRSYGKTVTTLALSHEEFRQSSRAKILQGFKDTQSDRINTAATLIITPGHLLSQWEKEIEKILPETHEEPGAVVVMKNTAVLCTKSVESFKNAKIVLVSSDLMTTQRYFEELAKLTALKRSMISDTNRVSKLWLNLALEELRVTAKHLQGGISNSDFLQWLDQRRGNNDRKFPELNRDEPALTGAENEPAVAEQSDGESESETKIRATKKAENPHSTVCPILHMFRWNRLVIDEFALVTSKPSLLFSCFVGLDADKRWILSGTPPLDDFHDIKLAAKLIGIDLGPDSFYPGIISSETLRNF